MPGVCTTSLSPLRTSRYEEEFLLVAVFFIVGRVCTESSCSTSPTPGLNLFLSDGAYIYVFFTSIFRVSEMSRHFFGLVIQLDSVKTTGSSFSLTVPTSSHGTWSLGFGSLSLGAVCEGVLFGRIQIRRELS